jgi:hypothetical protein
MSLNFHRLLIATLVFVLPIDIRMAILVTLALMMVSVFVGFKRPKIKDFDESVCIEE